jgi:hypothetical protein
VESNNTIAVVKHVLVDPPEKQNGPFLEERSHLALMVKDRPELLTVRERPWQQSTLDKVRRCFQGICLCCVCAPGMLGPNRRRRARPAPPDLGHLVVCVGLSGTSWFGGSWSAASAGPPSCRPAAGRFRCCRLLAFDTSTANLC